MCKFVKYSYVFMCSSKSVGGAKLETKRIRRRSISITPEIGDDIVRCVVCYGSVTFICMAGPV